LLFFLENHADLTFTVPFPEYLKCPGGQLPEDDNLIIHMISRDDYVSGAEMKALHGAEYYGKGLVSLSIALFEKVRLSLKAELAPECIHLGELVAYVYCAWMFGDLQMLTHVVNQLVRRKDKTGSNYRYKASAHASGNRQIIAFSVKGWGARYAKKQNVQAKAQPNQQGNGKKKDSKKRSQSAGPNRNKGDKGEGSGNHKKDQNVEPRENGPKQDKKPPTKKTGKVIGQSGAVMDADRYVPQQRGRKVVHEAQSQSPKKNGGGKVN
jgi:hypothetical protein